MSKTKNRKPLPEPEPPVPEATEPAVSEAASKKRGRPPVFDPGFVEFMAPMLGAKTQRGRQDALYATEALEALGAVREENPREFWFHSDERSNTTLLAALGRLGDPDLIRAAAEELQCAGRMPVKVAIAWIRRACAHTSGEPDFVAALSAFVERFYRVHAQGASALDRSILLDDMVIALEGVRDKVAAFRDKVEAERVAELTGERKAEAASEKDDQE